MKIIQEDNKNVLLMLTEKENKDDLLLKSNSVDAAFEKHVPQYTRTGDDVLVFVNHVMEEDHYIEWILVETGSEVIIKKLVPGEEPKVKVPYNDGMSAYAYCNKHSLWVNEEII